MRLVLATAVLTAGSIVGTAPPAYAGTTPPVVITQNYSQFIAGGFECQEPGWTVETHAYRRFDLRGDHAAAEGFRVSEVVFAAGETTPVTRDIPVNVRVQMIDSGDPMTLANLEPLASRTVGVDADDEFTLVSVPLTASLPAGKDLVLEVWVDTLLPGEHFRIGGNEEGEFAEEYWLSPGEPCQVNEISAVPLPTYALVLYAFGKAGECLTAEKSETRSAAKLRKAKKALRRANQAVRNADTAKEKDAAMAKQRRAKAKVVDRRRVLAKATSVQKKECAQPELP